MNPQLDIEGDRRQAVALLDCLTLVASVDVVARCWQVRCDRRSGDPRGQEPADRAAGRVSHVMPEIEDIVLQLRLNLLLSGSGESWFEASVRHFETLVLLRQCARRLQIVHQALLSLYPEVHDSVVEESRRLYLTTSRLACSPRTRIGSDLFPTLDRLDLLMARLDQDGPGEIVA